MKTELQKLLSFLVFMFFSVACGPQTATESLLSGSQDTKLAIELVTTHEGGKYSSIFVDTTDPLLPSQVNITRYAGRSLAHLPAQVEAEKLLSPYAEKTAYTYSKRKGPNCWHTSIASIFKEWDQSRHMSAQEYSCILRHYFMEVNSPKYGDTIRFRDATNREIHAATFIGIDINSSEAIVYTKNGFSKSEPWAFMSLADLKKVYPEAVKVRFFSPVKKVPAAVEEGDLCYSEFVTSQKDQEEMDKYAENLRSDFF